MKSSTILKRESMEMTLPVLIDLFIATKQSENKSANTLKWYRHMLSKFSDFLGGGTIKDFTLNNARAFVMHLQEREVRYENHPMSPIKQGGLRPSSVHGYVRTLKVFSSWLADDNYTTGNVLTKLKRPKLPETMIEILTQTEIESLFAELNPKCYSGNRLTCILSLMLDTGIRASELCSLTLENVNLPDNYIKVMGKGKKERVVPFGANTKKALLTYINTWRAALESPSLNLFLDLNGNPVTYNNLVHLFKNLGNKVGIPRLHPHLLRHSMAVNYLMEHKDVVTLKFLLGHTTVSTTEMYLKLTNSQILVQGRQSSLMDRIGIRKH